MCHLLDGLFLASSIVWGSQATPLPMKLLGRPALSCPRPPPHYVVNLWGPSEGPIT